MRKVHPGRIGMDLGECLADPRRVVVGIGLVALPLHPLRAELLELVHPPPRAFGLAQPAAGGRQGVAGPLARRRHARRALEDLFGLRVLLQLDVSFAELDEADDLRRPPGDLPLQHAHRLLHLAGLEQGVGQHGRGFGRGRVDLGQLAEVRDGFGEIALGQGRLAQVPPRARASGIDLEAPFPDLHRLARPAEGVVNPALELRGIGARGVSICQGARDAHRLLRHLLHGRLGRERRLGEKSVRV